MMHKSGKAMIHKGDKHADKAVGLVESAQEVRDLCRAAGLHQKNVKHAFKSVVGGGVSAFASHRHSSHEEKEQLLAMMVSVCFVSRLRRNFVLVFFGKYTCNPFEI